MKTEQLKQKFFENLVEGTFSILKENIPATPSPIRNKFTNMAKHEERWTSVGMKYEVSVKRFYYNLVSSPLCKCYVVHVIIDQGNWMNEKLSNELDENNEKGNNEVLIQSSACKSEIIKEMESLLGKNCLYVINNVLGAGRVCICFHEESISEAMNDANLLYNYIEDYYFET